MSFRLKVLIVVLLSVGSSILLVAWQISASARRAFDRLDEDRTVALVAQFQNEMQRRDADIHKQLTAIAATETALRIGLENSRALPDLSPFSGTAPELAASHSLDLLQFVAADGTIISSAQWPARFGYKDPMVVDGAPKSDAAFLKQEELADSSVLALVKIQALPVRDRNLYIVGGRKLDQEFLNDVVLPAGTRVMIYRVRGEGFSTDNLIAAAPLADAGKLAPLIRRVQAPQTAGSSIRNFEVIRWTA
ncbi:MAG: hypothetical protein ABIP12_02980, partial [Terriglobales bacterium]